MIEHQMNDLVVRELRSSDVPRLIEVGRQLFAREREVLGFGDEVIRKELNDYRLARFVGKLTGGTDQIFFVGEVDGIAVATTMINRISVPAWYVSSVMVDPHFQRRGYARRILELACSEIQKRRGLRAILHVASDNQAAKSLYSASGFKEFEHEVWYSRETRDVEAESSPSNYSTQEVGRYDKHSIQFIDGCLEPQSAEIYGSTIIPNLFQRALWKRSHGNRFKSFALVGRDSWVAVYSLFLLDRSETARLRVSVATEYRGKVEKQILTEAIKRSRGVGTARLVVSGDIRYEDMWRRCSELGFKHVYSDTGMVLYLA